MDKLPEYIDSNNPPPPFIPYGSDYLADSSVSVSVGYVRLNDDSEISPPPEPPAPAPNISPEVSGQYQWVHDSD